MLVISSCSTTPALAPGQLASRAIEVRPIDAPYDTAFRAAVHTIQFLNMTIIHTEKDAGLIVGTSTDPGTGKKATAVLGPMAASVLLLGPLGLIIGAPVGAALGSMNTETKMDLNLYLYPTGEKRTRLRINFAVDGKPVEDPIMIDRIWVIMQREALIELGEPVPPKLEERAQKILNPPPEEQSTEEDSEQNF